jgi:hypothetical protein
MSVTWDEFLAGFDRADEDVSDPFTVPDADPIFEQLIVLHDERAERADPTYFPSGPDPRGLERLLEQRRARGWRP